MEIAETCLHFLEYVGVRLFAAGHQLVVIAPQRLLKAGGNFRRYGLEHFLKTVAGVAIHHVLPIAII